MIYVGTSGFNYQHWRGRFYPEDLPEDRWLHFYAQRLNSVELNVTFYRMPRETAFKKWHKDTPKKFTFAIKANRYITHIKRLKDCRDSIRMFYDNIKPLRSKIRVILWQLPASLKPDMKRVAQFLRLIKKYPYDNALEVRNNLWREKEITDILSDYNVALCFADWPGVNIENPKTAPYIYIRRHGSQGLYYGWYSREALEGMKQMVRGYIKRGEDAYIYFNNDADAAAVHNAIELKDMLKYR